MYAFTIALATTTTIFFLYIYRITMTLSAYAIITKLSYYILKQDDLVRDRLQNKINRKEEWKSVFEHRPSNSGCIFSHSRFWSAIHFEILFSCFCWNDECASVIIQPNYGQIMFLLCLHRCRLIRETQKLSSLHALLNRKMWMELMQINPQLLARCKLFFFFLFALKWILHSCMTARPKLYHSHKSPNTNWRHFCWIWNEVKNFNEFFTVDGR